VDVSTPAAPYGAGSCDTPGDAYGVAAAGGYAYVADGGGSAGLQVIDISNPTNPHIVGAFDTPGAAYDVALAGSYAYVADSSSGLQVIDISNPAEPYSVGTCDTPGYADGVALAGNHAYVADAAFGLQVIDISNPANPYIVGTCDTPGTALHVTVAGSYAYVASVGWDLQVIDIGNPVNPILVGACSTPGNAYDVAVAGGYAYVADGFRAGLQVIAAFLPLESVSYVGPGTLTAVVPFSQRLGTWHLYVANPDGLTGIMHNAFTVVDVLVPPVADFTVDYQSGIAPLTVQFTDQSTGSIDTWEWDFDNNGTIDSHSQSPGPWTYTEAGDYTVSLTVTGSVGEDTETKTDYIHVSEPSGTPIIDKIRGVKEPGRVIRIIGSGFGEPQGNSEVHIGPKVYGPGDTKIKLWTDTEIKVKLLNYKCAWFKGNDFRRRKIWVMVGGEDGLSSNVKSIKVFKPDTCP
jgi:hypothetical protein